MLPGKQLVFHGCVTIVTDNLAASGLSEISYEDVHSCRNTTWNCTTEIKLSWIKKQQQEVYLSLAPNGHQVVGSPICSYRKSIKDKAELIATTNLYTGRVWWVKHFNIWGLLTHMHLSESCLGAAPWYKTRLTYCDLNPYKPISVDF